jgi:competence ComEA-like helix-hairpin-helix protein
MQGAADKIWLIIASFLTLSLISGLFYFALKLGQLKADEIILSNSASANITGSVFIDGAVIRPGIYTVRGDDTVNSLLTSAGLSDNADILCITIHVPDKTRLSQPQKVNLNRADIWLLQALPGIGESRARLIVDYRNKHGPYRSVDDLLHIEGFSESLVEKIRSYTVAGD